MPIEGFGEITERLRRSTVHVAAGRRGHGSGFIVGTDGRIVTNAHVVASGLLEVHLWDGTRAAAELLLCDQARDLAVLRVARSGLPAVKLADSDRLRVGELVIAVGNPLGFIGALTTGVIHAIGRVPGLGPLEWIHAYVRLAPGNSGGPLANANGEVIGVNTMIAGGVGLAIPSNSFSRLLNRGNERAPLGVVVRPVHVILAQKRRLGLLILEVARNGAAWMASLRPGDILVGTEGVCFETMEDFERVFDGDGERAVRLEFLRGGWDNLRTVAVRLGLTNMAAA